MFKETVLDYKRGKSESYIVVVFMHELRVMRIINEGWGWKMMDGWDGGHGCIVCVYEGIIIDFEGPPSLHWINTKVKCHALHVFQSWAS